MAVVHKLDTKRGNWWMVCGEHVDNWKGKSGNVWTSSVPSGMNTPCMVCFPGKMHGLLERLIQEKANGG